MDNKILLTGATGFVGIALCKQLIQQGFHVRAAVRQLSSNLDHAIEQVVVGDLENQINWHESIQGITTIIHLAARVHVMQETANNPLTAFRSVNYFPTIKLAQTAANNGVKRFIYVSTVKVNGEITHITPFSEQDPVAPQDAYAISKCEAEQFLQQLANDTHLEVTIVRPTLVYGPGVKGNFINLLKLVNKGFPLPLNNIHNRRSMVYLDNLVDALFICIKHPNAANQIFLVSDEYPISTSDLLRDLGELLNKPNRLFTIPENCLKLIGKVVNRSAEFERVLNSLEVNTNKIFTVLKWKPPFTTREGLHETVKWFLKNYDKKNI